MLTRRIRTSKNEVMKNEPNGEHAKLCVSRQLVCDSVGGLEQTKLIGNRDRICRSFVSVTLRRPTYSKLDTLSRGRYYICINSPSFHSNEAGTQHACVRITVLRKWVVQRSTW